MSAALPLITSVPVPALRVALLGVFPFSRVGGGAPGRLRNLGLALKQAGQAAVVLAAGAESTHFEWNGVRVEQFGHEVEPGDWHMRGPRRINDGVVDAMIWRLEGMHRSRELDVVIFYNQDLVYAWRVQGACRRLGVPFVQQYAECHLASDFPEGWRNTYFLLETLHLRLMPRWSDGAIVISQELKRIIERVRGASAVLIPTITELDPPIPAGPDGATLRVTCISRGARRDDLPLLLEVACRLKARRCDVKFRLLGLDPGALARVVARAGELGVEDRVRVDGFLPEADFAKAVAQTDLMVLLRTDDLSSRACFPSRLHELFSPGAPVLLSAVGDVVRYFKDDSDCLMVPAGDAAAIEQKIEWVLANRSTAAEIGRQGRSHAAELFEPKRYGTSLARYLASLVRRRPSLPVQ